ncbi:hypothetical protein LSM04_002369 [Trypanosoma melophagium]|uniref:uncharacterized protein n=1 Tax=Trypanosoma melophagium TaxID=715481 RepID=UPI00351A2EE7|nr:hypothetical protein LSM04_002369 [Trypanosoma melophagium]
MNALSNRQQQQQQEQVGRPPLAERLKVASTNPHQNRNVLNSPPPSSIAPHSSAFSASLSNRTSSCSFDYEEETSSYDSEESSETLYTPSNEPFFLRMPLGRTESGECWIPGGVGILTGYSLVSTANGEITSVSHTEFGRPFNAVAGIGIGLGNRTLGMATVVPQGQGPGISTQRGTGHSLHTTNSNNTNGHHRNNENETKNGYSALPPNATRGSRGDNLHARRQQEEAKQQGPQERPSGIATRNNIARMPEKAVLRTPEKVPTKIVNTKTVAQPPPPETTRKPQIPQGKEVTSTAPTQNLQREMNAAVLPSDVPLGKQDMSASDSGNDDKTKKRIGTGNTRRRTGSQRGRLALEIWDPVLPRGEKDIAVDPSYLHGVKQPQPQQPQQLQKQLQSPPPPQEEQKVDNNAPRVVVAPSSNIVGNKMPSEQLRSAPIADQKQNMQIGSAPPVEPPQSSPSLRSKANDRIRETKPINAVNTTTNTDTTTSNTTAAAVVGMRQNDLHIPEPVSQQNNNNNNNNTKNNVDDEIMKKKLMDEKARRRAEELRREIEEATAAAKDKPILLRKMTKRIALIPSAPPVSTAKGNSAFNIEENVLPNAVLIKGQLPVKGNGPAEVATTRTATGATKAEETPAGDKLPGYTTGVTSRIQPGRKEGEEKQQQQQQRQSYEYIDSPLSCRERLIIKEEEAERRRIQRRETAERALVFNKIVDVQQTLSTKPISREGEVGTSLMNPSLVSRGNQPMSANNNQPIPRNSDAQPSKIEDRGLLKPRNTKENKTTTEGNPTPSSCATHPTGNESAVRTSQRRRRHRASIKRHYRQLIDMPPSNSRAVLRSLITSQILPEYIEPPQALQGGNHPSHPCRPSPAEQQRNSIIPAKPLITPPEKKILPQKERDGSTGGVGLMNTTAPPKIPESTHNSTGSSGYGTRGRRPSRTPSPVPPAERRVGRRPSAKSAIVVTANAGVGSNDINGRRNDKQNKQNQQQEQEGMESKRKGSVLPPLATSGRHSGPREGTWVRPAKIQKE